MCRQAVIDKCIGLHLCLTIHWPTFMFDYIYIGLHLCLTIEDDSWSVLSDGR